MPSGSPPQSPFLDPRLLGSPWWLVPLCLGILQGCKFALGIASQFPTEDQIIAHFWNTPPGPSSRLAC